MVRHQDIALDLAAGGAVAAIGDSLIHYGIHRSTIRRRVGTDAA